MGETLHENIVLQRQHVSCTRPNQNFHATLIATESVQVAVCKTPSLKAQQLTLSSSKKVTTPVKAGFFPESMPEPKRNGFMLALIWYLKNTNLPASATIAARTCQEQAQMSIYSAAER